jgi:hypothetical protein
MATTVTPISTQTNYNISDEILLNSSITQSYFNPGLDYIEYTITTPDNSFSTIDYDYREYSFPNSGVTSNFISDIVINPESDLFKSGFNSGEYNVYYNFLKNELSSSFNNQNFFIKEISSDRTELILNSVDSTDIINLVSTFKDQLNSNPNYFQDFYLNFGNNVLCIANNINIDTNTLDIFINLYEPLPNNIQVKNTLWVVTQIANELAFNIITIPDPVIPTITSFPLNGPNFNLPTKDQINNSTEFQTYSTLITSSLLSTSYSQLNNLISSSGIQIGIDYTNFSNFVHFSSAVTRINNFYYKKQLIDEYQQEVNILSNITSLNTSNNTTLLIKQINNIIENFDGYEYFLYYGTGSWSYPKSGSSIPSTLYPAGSPEVLAWLGSVNNLTGILGSASLYDRDNLDYLYNTVPNFIQEDPQNDPYKLFVEMVAQHYDNIWVYYKDVTNRYNADNRLNYGISKDLVANALKSFGVKLYQNNFSSNDLYSAFLGYGNPNPSITRSLGIPAYSGQEYIENYITASYYSLEMPLDDVNKEVYKRIYHNLPYLSKTKGTIPGLRALINCFGISDTILRISEFGGRDKDTSTYDLFNQNFNYALYIPDSTSDYISTAFDLNPEWEQDKPASIQFRFKPDEEGISTPNSQSLVYFLDITNAPFSASLLALEYTGSGYKTASYDGATYSSSYAYANLKFYPNLNDLNSFAQVSLPFYNGEWWSVQLNRTSSISSDTFTLYAGSKGYYDGYDGNQILYIASSSVIETTTDTPWNGSSGNIYFTKFAAAPINPGTKNFNGYVGSLQEIRYWAKSSSVDSFRDFIMNPHSIDYKWGENEYANYLAFRAPLGSELEPLVPGLNNMISVHPKVTGSWIATTSSFSGDSNYSILGSAVTYPNVESYFYNQPIAGIKNRVTDKIQIVNSIYPTGSVLSQYRSLEQDYSTLRDFRSPTIEDSELGSEVPDINLLEVAFSPQNEVNDDIISSLGYFNIGEYIGDPRQITSRDVTYPDLVNLSNEFFQKYFASYNLFDYIRLIKYFDNSLFKMIQDFVPARTSLASGVVIKQHLLERNKYPQPLVEWEDVTYTGSIYSQQVWDGEDSYTEFSTIGDTLGSTGGTFNQYNILAEYQNRPFTISGSGFSVDPEIPINYYLVSSSNNTITINNPINNNFAWDESLGELITYFYGDIKLFISGTNSPSGNTIKFYFSSSKNGVISTLTQGSPTFSYTTPLISCSYGERFSLWIEDGGSGPNIVSPRFGIANIYPYSNQSWDENNIGPKGVSIILHSTQDEFYNGELPGSEIIATDGELNENNIYKYPDDKPKYYNPALYLSNITDLNTFTNPNTSPNDGEIYLWFDSGSRINPGVKYAKVPTLSQIISLGLNQAIYVVNRVNGVKYIKLNRYDAEGGDQIQYLGQLKNITLTYPDRSPVKYNIVGAQNFGNYYLYSIGPYTPGSMTNFNTSSVGDIKNYDFLATSASTFTAPSAGGVGLISDVFNKRVTSFGSVIGNSINFFTASNGIYNSLQTPNVGIKVQISGSGTTTAILNSIFIVKNENTEMSATNYVNDLSWDSGETTFNTTFYLTSSFKIFDGDEIGFGVMNTFGTTTVNTFHVSMSSFNLTSFDGSSSLAIFDPYIGNFDYNEYNALLDNAETPQESVFLMDVDYSQNPLIPVNQSFILDGEANRAQVQDSNYTSKAWSNIRYIGSKNNSYRNPFI